MIRHSAQVRQPPQWKPARHQRERQAQITHVKRRWQPFSSPIQAEWQVHLSLYDATTGNLVGINQTPTSATRA